MRGKLMGIAAVVAGSVLAGCGAGDGSRVVRTSPPSSRGALPSKIERPAPLKTESFESGEVRLGEANSYRLEAMLQDLNRRKDADYAANGGKPGPDAGYLNEWVEKVTAELLRRGYYVDAGGTLRRPGEVVPWR